jgi:hypothetical protein
LAQEQNITQSPWGRSSAKPLEPLSRPQVRQRLREPSSRERQTCWMPELSSSWESTPPSRVQVGAWPKSWELAWTSNGLER